MKTRICTKCGKGLPPTTKYFYKKKGGKFGLDSRCIECCIKYKKQRYKEKRNWILNQQKKYLQSEKGRTWRKKYCKLGRDKAVKRKYRQSEKGKKTQKRFYNKNKLACTMSTAIGRSLKENNKAGRHWETLVPYTLEDLKQYLENLFQPKMSWNNYGEWHVDHKIPRSSFKFANSEDKEFQKCWALKNLQPLWAEENLRKCNKLVW